MGGGGTRQLAQLTELPLASIAVITGSAGRIMCQVTAVAPPWVGLPIFFISGSASTDSVNFTVMYLVPPEDTQRKIIQII
jgi:hypothetical protein